VAPNQSIEIYLSCSSEDEKLGSKLAEHLRALELYGVITVWQSCDICAGADRINEIEKHLNSARIILLLISSSFFASEEHCKLDMPRAMERHKAKEACVIPVLLRPCDWKNSQFAGLQALPKNEEAITSWSNQDEAFKEVATEIRKAIEKKSDYISLPQKTKRRLKIPWRSLRTTLVTSMGVTTLVVVMRLFGIFQASELWFFDRMMQQQPDEKKDERLLLVQITSKDIQTYARDPSKEIPKYGASLPDKIIFELLNSLLKKEPRVIGVDIYRDFPAYDKDLAQLLEKKNQRLIFVCKFPDNTYTTYKNEGHDPPPGFPIEQVGLSDFTFDSNKVIRRQILQMGTPNNQDTNKSKCRNNPQEVMDSFSYKVAQIYLAAKNKEYRNRELNELLKSGNTVLQKLDLGELGGYSETSNEFNGGYEILLNYRSVFENNKESPHYIARRFTVEQVLQGKIEDNLVKDKIVLIGTNTEGYDNVFATPFSIGGRDAPMPGLYIQAQMVSQLVSAVLDGRPLLKVWSRDYEVVWILCWSLIGAILPQVCKQPRNLLLVTGTCLTILYFICLFIFINSDYKYNYKYWIPLVPPFVALLGSGGVIIFMDVQSQKKLKSHKPS
jgi:CHASE2 domain-containing sensor protein